MGLCIGYEIVWEYWEVLWLSTGESKAQETKEAMCLEDSIEWLWHTQTAICKCKLGDTSICGMCLSLYSHHISSSSVVVFVLVVLYECICGLWVPLAGREVGLCSLVSNFFWEISLSQSLEISTSPSFRKITRRFLCFWERWLSQSKRM